MTEQGGGMPKLLMGAMVVGLAGLLASLALDLERFAANWIVWFLFLLSIGIGTLFMVAIEHLVASIWSVPLRRVPERLSSIIVGLVPVALIALFLVPTLYPWATAEAAADPLIAMKAKYLNLPFFAGRAAICFVVWCAAWWLLSRGSVGQDVSKDPQFTVRARKVSALFMFAFAATVTIAAVDWLMSLEPHWFSTIFGVYVFGGAVVAGFAATTLGVIYLRNRDRLPKVRPDHLYSLGGLMFAFTVFWAYIAFSQFMLIWYGNLPEEVVWFQHRSGQGWTAVTVLLAVIRFVVPFFALLSRDAKTNPHRLRWVACWILAGHVLDLYWIVFPVLGRGVLVGWPEMASALFFVAVALWWARRSMSKGEDMPVGDPNLKAGLDFHL